MIDLNRQTECSGCGACANICPRGAIRLLPDDSGFLYPQIDPQACTQCSLCSAVCQMEARSAREPFPRAFYALINQNDAQRKVSSSGGAFLAVAEYVFAQGGVVVGCAFDKDLKAVHILTHSLEECTQKLCGSKYVQSETGDTYGLVRSLLAQGRTVLYTGTPCQIDGLLLYLRKKPDNLITMDLICHGVSSPVLWEKHRQYLEKNAGGPLLGYRFRDKQKAGLAYYHYSYKAGGKQRHGPSVLDPYYTDFLKGRNLRESCYQCRYTNLDRVGDLTIGDFWGVKKQLPQVDPQGGVSLVLVNTPRGEQILREIGHRVSLMPVSQEAATADNHRLSTPTPRPEGRDAYYERCYADFEGWETSFVRSKAWKLAKLKSLIPAPIKRLLQR